MSTIAILGVGAMGSAVLGALVADGIPPGQIKATTLDPDAGQAARRQYGVEVVDNLEAVRDAEVVVLAVKPADVAALLAEIGPGLADAVLVISLCAGVSLARLEGWLPPGTSVVRVMPNVPALIGAGMSAVSPGRACPPEQLERAVRLLSSCGEVVVVPEHQQDAVTAVSGSGPAYVFYLVEAMVEAGVQLGLPRPVATKLAVQTVHGAALMMRDGGSHPSLLREQVTSPGGTTVAALAALDERAVRAAVMSAVRAAADRSAQLGG